MTTTTVSSKVAASVSRPAQVLPALPRIPSRKFFRQ